MKKKLSRILGVGLTLGLLTSLMVGAAPASALSQPKVTIADDDEWISLEDPDYVIRFTLDVELGGTSTGAFTLPDIGDTFRITDSGAGTDGVYLTHSGFITVTMTGGAYTPLSTTTGWIAFAAAGGTADVAATAANQTGTWQQTDGAPTATVLTEVDEPVTVIAAGGAFGLPDVTDAFTITGTTGAAENGTITVTAGQVTATPTGTATVATGTVPVVITLASGSVAWTAPAATDTIVVTGDAAATTGTWTNVLAGAVAAMSTETDEDIILGALVDDGQTITITFPDGYEVTDGVLANVTATATSGWIGGVPDQASDLSHATWVGDEDELTITGTLGGGGQAGEGAGVRVAITAGITNPSTPGTYTLTVETTEEDDAVTSASFAITVPDVDALPGVVTIYNPDGHLMDQATGAGCIGDMIAAAGDGYTIEIGEGVYTEWSLNTTWDDLTIVATGDVWSTEVHAGLGGAGWTIDSEGVTIDGLFLIEASPYITADNATVQNCVIEYFWWGWGRGLVIAAEDATVTGNRFDAIEETWGVDTSYTAIGLYVGWGASSDGALISGNEFNVDEDRFGIIVEAGADEDISIVDNTFTGSSGTGIQVLSGTVGIAGNTLGGLAIALDVAGGTVTVADTVITNCGTAAETDPTDPFDGTPAIAIGGGALEIRNSEISNSADYAIFVGEWADDVDIMFNTISGNLLNIYSEMVGTVNATHNWWGVDTGPAEDTIVEAAEDTLVDVSGFLGATATGTFVTGEATLTARTTVGVDVSSDAVADVIGVGNYAENPQSATPEPALEGGFYDVYLAEAAGDTDSVLIRFYNPNITENTVIYVWGTIAGGWVPCTAANQGVNTFSGFAYVRVTSTTTPSIGDLTGTPFALCEPPVEIAAPAAVLPILGAADVSLTPTLTWDAVDDATSYDIEVAADSTFATVDYSATTVVNGHLVAEDLDYGTTYYWRVRTISDALTSSWSAGSMFTTVAEEPEPEIALPEIVFPAIGAMGITSEPTYSWEAVAGADHYDFEVAEDLGLLTKDNPFAMLDYSVSCLINAHAAQEALKLESSYYWRVRTVIELEEGVEVGAWVTGYFTVMGEPEEAEPPIVVEEITPVTPQITIEPVVIPPQEVIIEIAPDEVVQVIPDYLLWIIVVVGAVLIIAVIVLIVRTRRVA